MECIYRWIQLSDIHFQTKETMFNTKQLRDSLPKYLEDNFAGQVNGLFLTGDYRYAPEKEENPAKVIEYIRDCAEKLRVKKEQIITIPGNHDLARSDVRTLVVEGLRNKYKPKEGLIQTTVINELNKGFSFYDELHRNLEDASTWQMDNPHAVIDMGYFCLLILNTAFTACGDNDEKNLIIGSSFLDACLLQRKNDKPVIALGHHGFDWLRDEEKQVCAKFLEKHGVSLYLCGHAHETGFSVIGEKIKQVNIGCIIQDEKDVYAGFSVGELYLDGTVSIFTHKWEDKQQTWVTDHAYVRENIVELPLNTMPEETAVKKKVEKNNYPFSVEGYHLLGGLGEDGIKYIWKKGNHFVESLAFNRRCKINNSIDEDMKTSAYTISTSIGCQLSVSGEQCLFCGTGNRQFIANLKAEEIALQCIFMAKYDSNCPSYPQVRANKREFAFMGQGEPGMNYTAIREAILLNDYVMERLGQEVSRYIISTSGITDFIPSLAEDIKRGIYRNPVTIHFSLNTVEPERSKLMPISRSYDYHEFLEQCKLLYQITKSKIGVGLLMLSEYRVDNGAKYTLTIEKLKMILDELDSDIFKIDLCTVNKCGKGKQGTLSNETARSLLKIVSEKGFEGKIFSSFGDSDKSGCGMLDSIDNDVSEIGNTTISQFNESVKLLNEAKIYRNKKILDE